MLRQEVTPNSHEHRCLRLFSARLMAPRAATYALDESHRRLHHATKLEPLTTLFLVPPAISYLTCTAISDPVLVRLITILPIQPRRPPFHLPTHANTRAIEFDHPVTAMKEQRG